MKKLLLIGFFILSSLCFAGKLRDETNVSKKQEEIILNILKECGFDGKIANIKHDEMLDGLYSETGKGYRIDFNDGVKNTALYLTEKGDVEAIRYNTINFYKDGKVLENVKDYKVTLHEANDYIIRCQHVIESLLVAPSTVKFPNINSWSFSKKKGILTVQAYVDSQNSYGAMVRSYFQFIIDTKNQKVKSLILDGQEYMK